MSVDGTRFPGGRAVLLLALLLPVGLLVAGCHSTPAGPSLSAVSLTAPRLSPTTGNSALCCCRVGSVATNGTRETVHLTIKFSAFNALQNDPFASIVYFIPNLLPGASSPVDAPGFVVPCVNIDRVLYELSVKGLGSPPY